MGALNRPKAGPKDRQNEIRSRFTSWVESGGELNRNEPFTLSSLKSTKHGKHGIY